MKNVVFSHEFEINIYKRIYQHRHAHKLIVKKREKYSNGKRRRHINREERFEYFNTIEQKQTSDNTDSLSFDSILTLFYNTKRILSTSSRHILMKMNAWCHCDITKRFALFDIDRLEFLQY